MDLTWQFRRLLGAAATAAALVVSVATCGGERSTGPRLPTPAALTRATAEGQSGTAGQPLPSAVGVKVVDATGAPVPGVVVAWSVTVGGGSVTPATSTSNSAGIAFATWTLGTVAGANAISAAVQGNTSISPVVFGATGVAGPPSRLIFEAQPTAVTAGSAIAPAVQITAQDALGNPVTAVPVAVTVAIAGGAGTFGATLSGTLTQSTVGGVATFANLAVDKSGSGYALTATATGLPGATSAVFAVNPGAPAKLAFTVQPGSGTAGAALSPVAQVTVQDAQGNTVPTATNAVTVAIAAGTGAAGAVLGGTLTQSASSGVATFANLTVDKAGSGYTLSASATGLVGANSAAFGIAPGAISAARSVVTVSRAAIASGDTATLLLRARDALGNDLSSGGATVVFTASGGTSTGRIGATTDRGDGTYAATLTGLVAGTATSVGATLSGTAVTGPLPTITVGPGTASQLAVSSQPAGGVAGSSFGLAVTARDANGNTASDFTGTVAVAITTGTGKAGAHLLGTTSVAAVAGVVTFGGLSIDSAASGYTLTLSATGLASATSAAFAVTAGAASPSASVVTVARSQIASGDTVTAMVQARDAFGNALSSGGLAVAFSAAAGTSTGSFGATTDRGNGAYTALFTASAAGTATTIGATIGGVAVTGTLPTLTVIAGAVSQLQFTSSPPSSATAGAPFGVNVTARDAAGNVAVAFTGNVLVAITTGTGTAGAHLLGATSVAATSGLSTFSGLSIDSAGTGYTLTASTTGATSAASAGFGITVGAASATRSRVTISRATVTSGDTALVTLRAVDAIGNALTGGGLTVTFGVGGGTSTGTFGATTDRGDGSYTAIFTGVLAGSAATISATIAGVTAAQTASVTVLSGTVSAAQSTIAASPVSIAADGSTSTITVAAKDAAGNGIPGATVVLAATGAGNTVTQPVGPTNAGGTATGTLRSTVAEAKTVSATINGIAVGQTTTVTVTSAAQAAVTLVVPGSGTVGATGLAASASGGSGTGALSYASSTPAVCTVNAASGSITALTVGTCSLTATRAADATYAAATSAPGSFTITAGSQAITFGALPGKTYGDAPFTVSATGGASGNAVTFTAGPSAVCTASGTTVTLTGAGSCTVTASQAGNANYAPAPDVARTFAVATLAASVTPNAAGKAFGASDPTLTGTLSGFLAGDGVTATYARTAGETVAGSPYTISATLSPTGVLGNYSITYNTAAFTISAATQSITFAQPTTPATYGSSFAIAPTASSGLTVSVAASGGCTESAGTVTMNSGTSSCVLTASQAGNANYDAASDVVRTVAAATRAASVTPDAAGKAFGASDPTLTGTLAGFVAGDGVTATYARTAGETVAGSPYTISATLSPAGVLGNYSITYNTAAFTINAATQSITFAQLTTPATYGSSFAIAPTASSGLTVSVAASGGCTESAGTVTMTSGTSSCVLTASQAGNGNYAAASDVVRTVAASLATQATVTLTVPPSDSVGAAGLTASASGGSGTGALSYASSTTAVCTVSAGSGSITALTPGTCTLTATRASDGNYAAATSTVESFAVTAGAATQIALNGGDSQSATVNATVTTAPSVLVRDSHNDPVAGVSVTFAIATGGGSVTGGSAATNASGIATVGSWTLGTGAGANTLTATATGLTGSPVTFSATGTPGAISAAGSTVTVPQDTVVSDSAVTLTLQARDAFGNAIGTGGASVVFMATGGTSTGTIGATTDHGDGTYTATFTGLVAGTAKAIGATIGGTPVSTTLPTLRVTAGRATRLSMTVQPTNTVAATAFSPAIEVRAVDRVGNVDTLYTGGGFSVGLEIVSGSGTSGASLTGTTSVDAVKGVATFGAVSIDSAGTGYRLNAFYIAPSPYSLRDDTSGTFNITAGAISTAKSVVTVSSATVPDGGTVTLTLQAKDDVGNNLTTGGATVVFTYSGGTSTGTITGLTDNTNGTYTATFTATAAGTPVTINATINGGAVTTSLPTITVTP